MSDESKHTAGPWQVNDCDWDRFGKTYWVESEEGQFICEVVRNSQFREVANAHLIAAAPNMYSALDSAPVLSEPESIESFVTRYIAWFGERREKALAKARGEST